VVGPCDSEARWVYSKCCWKEVIPLGLAAIDAAGLLNNEENRSTKEAVS
jgi:hypothetical protein